MHHSCRIESPIKLTIIFSYRLLSPYLHLSFIRKPSKISRTKPPLSRRQRLRTIITTADAAAVNAANAAAAGDNDDNAITTSKQVSVISSAVKISLDERQRDNQPDERHTRYRWQQKQQQLQLCNNQQKRNGTKTCSSSHQEVVARRLTWRHWLCNCRGGSNDNYDAEMTTTTMTTTAASIGSNVGTDTAALLRQWLRTQGKCSPRQR